jgi:hypothetical protein
MSEAMKFDLDRETNMKHRIDPTGKKWEIHGKRGSSLVHARPNPDRADAQIPKEFEGEWTSPTVLKEKIDTWLTKVWNKSDELVRVNAMRAGRGEVLIDELPPHVQKTAEESLAELDPAIREALGDTIATGEPKE